MTAATMDDGIEVGEPTTRVVDIVDKKKTPPHWVRDKSLLHILYHNLSLFLD